MQESLSESSTKCRKVIKIGHSIGLTLPKKLATDAGLAVGTPITVTTTDQGILIRKDDAQVDPAFIKNLMLGMQQYHRTLDTLRQGDE